MEDKKEIARIRATKWCLDNPERAAASRRAWYLRNKEKMRLYNLEYRKINHDELVEYDRKRNATEERVAQHKKWRDAHPETNRGKVMKWRKDNPEKARETQCNSQGARRARMKNSPYERIDPAIVYAKDGGICGICGKHLEMSDFTMDHIVPISKGGGHLEANVHSAHRLCNIRRGNRPLNILYSI